MIRLHSIAPTLIALCLAAGAGQVYPQWVEDSIQVPGAWVGSLVYDPQQDEVWGQTESGSRVFVISCDSDRVVAEYPLAGAFALAFDSTDNKMYVTYHGTDVESLAVMGGATHQVIRLLEMPGSTNPVWDAVSDRVYVSCQTVNRVAVLDCRTDSLLCYIPAGACPIKMYVNTLRRKLYILNYDAGTVSVVDMGTNQVTKTVVIGGANPNAGYYCRRVDKFYSDGSLGNVTVIDGRTDSVVARVPVAPYGQILAATGNEQAALVMAGVYTGDFFVYALNATVDSVTAFLHVSGVPYGLAYSEASDRLYCTDNSFGSVSVIAGDGSSLIKTLPLGLDPFVFAEVPKHGRVYVGDLARAWVYVTRDSATAVAEGTCGRPSRLKPVAAVPNPFLRTVAFVGSLGEGDVVVYSPAGKLVRRLPQTRRGGQWLGVVWDGSDSYGHPVPAGVYFAEVGTGCRVKVVKARQRTGAVAGVKESRSPGFE
jgi:YVTN family beta-propeller protein